MTRPEPDLSRAVHTGIRVAPSAKAVVIGAGLGGLAAAMRLGAKGYHVTVLDRLDCVGGRGSAIWQDGYRFDLGPTIITVPHVLRELWAACGADFDRDVDLRPLDPFYEIRWQDGSYLRTFADDNKMSAEIARLAPGDLRGYRQFLDDAEARYAFGFEQLGRRSMHQLWELIKVLPRFAWLRADRSIYAHAARRVRDPRLRMALSFHPLFIGGDPSHVTSMYALVSHLEKAFGVHYAMGGVVAIARAMQNVIESQGGVVRLNADVDEIEIAQERVRGVRLASGERLSADIVVSNADAGHTYARLLPRRPRKRWTPKRLRRARWSMGLFVWYFGTKATRDLWPDIGHHTILNGPRYRGLLRDIFIHGRLSEDMSLYLHRPTVTDPSTAPKGDDCFYVLSPVPHLGHADAVDWDREAPRYKAKVMEQLEQHLLPGLSKHISSEYLLTPKEFETRYKSPHGVGFSLEPRIFQSAWFRPHNISEEVDGLYLVGAGTHPGAGVPGVISSAEVLSQLVPHAEHMVKR